MSLLQEIQAECTAKGADVPRLLRLCLQLAGRLKHGALREWVLWELNGYPSEAQVPKYRTFAVRSLGHFVDRVTGSEATLMISLGVLPENLRTEYAVVRLDQPISQYQQLVHESASTVDQSGVVTLPWRIEHAVKYGSKMTQGLQCINAWREIPIAGLVGMLDTVKTRVLSMVLDLEGEDPRAGEVPSDRPSISEAKVTQIITTNIYGGNVQNLSAGSSGVSQAAGDQVVAGDVESLARALTAAGVTAEETAELRTALAVDAPQPSGSFGASTTAWLKKFARSAASSGREVAIGLVTQVLSKYVGLQS